MALFKKPKKNIRKRNVEQDENDDDDRDENTNMGNKADDSNTGVAKQMKDMKRDKVRTKPAPLLSFHDEEEDGEVFQIKKSSHSKKLVKLLDKERKKKKEKSERMEVGVEDDVEPKGKNCHKPVKDASDDDVVLILRTSEEEKLRQAELQKKNMVVLNGRAALAAGRDDLSSSEDDDEGSTKHKFSQPDHAKIMIESGKIPDAATIHAARKRRQRARELGTEYIPVESTPKYESRLVREDDNDGSEDEEECRVDMTVNLEAKARDDRRQNFFNEEVPVPEDEEWESQQIRKGVTGVALTSAPTLLLGAETPDQSLVPPPSSSLPESKDLPTPQVITQKLKDRLTELMDLHRRHQLDRERAVQDLEESIAQTESLEVEAPALADKFRFYQEMCGYVTDLVECLDEKMPGLLRLEEKFLELWAERTEYFAERRRQDVRDQADEMSHHPKGALGGPRWTREEEEARCRRAAEREGRRTRRRRTRELRAIPVTHVDGMSSDDEVTELEATSFKVKMEEVSRLGLNLLCDVEEEFGTVEGVAVRLERWRRYDMTEYAEAYASLCLPKIMGPIVRLNLLTWNPIETDTSDPEACDWWGRLHLYGLKEKETCRDLAADPDVLLVPLVVERVLIPKLTQLVDKSWDPMSSTQTLRLVGLIGKYVNEVPTLGPKSRHLEALLRAVLEKLKAAVDNDVFIPINLKIADARPNTTLFFQRQFMGAVKLLRNTLSFQGLIGPEQLQEIALDALLNRYLLAALRTCPPCEAITKANMIISTFPRWWFQKETKVQRLEMLSRHLKHLSTQVTEFDTTEKEAYELVNSLLRTLELSCPASI